MRNLFVACLTLCGLGAFGVGFMPEHIAVADMPVKADAPAVKFDGGRLSLRSLAKANSASTPLFTADVDGALDDTWTCGFDDGSMGGWTVDFAEHVAWTVKAGSGDKSYNAFDADNTYSLYVEGSFKVYEREISTITSQVVNVPFGGTFACHVGYSLNYDDCCRLVISVSDDDFATSTDIWNSKDGEGEKPWAWRAVKADLGQWAGKNVKLRLSYTWGSGDEIFKTGGYMGDFMIDGMRISGMAPVTSVDILTGETLKLKCLVEDAAEFAWTMPGAVPSQSTEASPEIYYTADGQYDITLDITKADGQTESYTAENFVTVTGFAPTAAILPPATFRYVDPAAEYNYMVAPLAPVKFKDASKGFPDERTWVFSGITDGDADAITEITDAEPSVSFMFQHAWPVGLAVGNKHGESSDIVTVAAEYQGAITNWQKGDAATTLDMDDWGVFPGSNTHNITRYAERFSAPSRPVVMGGAYLYFVDVPKEIAVTDNSTITVSVYTCENGLPGQRLDFGLWDVIDLNGPASDGSLQGTWFEFTDLPVVADEFFIVVDGLPEPSETCPAVSFGMAKFRDGGNTALMEIDGQWREADEYFGAGKCTSYLVRPVIRHSVITSLPVGNDEILFAKEGGTAEHQIFSYMGREENVDCDADWCRVTSAPGEYTVDNLTVECDPNPTGTDREARLLITDGAGYHQLTVKQSSLSGVESPIAVGGNEVSASPAMFTASFEASFPAGTSTVSVVDLSGRVVYTTKVADAACTSLTIDGSAWAKGMYILIADQLPVKIVKL